MLKVCANDIRSKIKFGKQYSEKSKFPRNKIRIFCLTNAFQYYIERNYKKKKCAFSILCKRCVVIGTRIK